MRTAEMIRKDQKATRANWLKVINDARERRELEATSFLAYREAGGRVVDFQALRMTFITKLGRSGVSPKMAQMLARDSDINLTILPA